MITCPYCRAQVEELARHYGLCESIRFALDPTYFPAKLYQGEAGATNAANRRGKRGRAGAGSRNYPEAQDQGKG